jgi:hypothetical protein
LLSISQLYDKDNDVIFKSLHFLVTHIIENKIIFIGKRLENTYIIDSREIDNDVKCLVLWWIHLVFGIEDLDTLTYN